MPGWFRKIGGPLWINQPSTAAFEGSASTVEPPISSDVLKHPSQDQDPYLFTSPLASCHWEYPLRNTGMIPWSSLAFETHFSPLGIWISWLPHQPRHRLRRARRHAAASACWGRPRSAACARPGRCLNGPLAAGMSGSWCSWCYKYGAFKVTWVCPKNGDTPHVCLFQYGKWW